MSDLTKAKFYIESQEFDKAEAIFADAFEKNDSNTDALIGLVIIKLNAASIDSSRIKSFKAYTNLLKSHTIDDIQKIYLVENIKDSVKSVVNIIDKDLKEKASEILKRPIATGVLVSVQRLTNTSHHLENVNNAFDFLADTLQIVLDLNKNILKDNHDIKTTIFNEINRLFELVLNTHNMNGDQLLSVNKKVRLHEILSTIRSDTKLDTNKFKKTTVNKAASGCLIFIIYGLTIVTATIGAIILVI